MFIFVFMFKQRAQERRRCENNTGKCKVQLACCGGESHRSYASLATAGQIS